MKRKREEARGARWSPLGSREQAADAARTNRYSCRRRRFNRLVSQALSRPCHLPFQPEFPPGPSTARH